jgi:transposase
VVIDADGKRLLSRRVMNDETELLQLIRDVLEISGDVLWAVDINTGIAALATALLLNHGQPVAYLTGQAIHQASTTYRGEGKTDARDAFIIADQARIRRDVSMLRRGDDIALDLRLLTSRRLDVVHDRTRQINRLRAQLLEFFPALERALDLTEKGPVLLLTAYQTPAAIRRMGVRRLET